jgi:putative beta-lysine N-acetyltransferase
MKDIIQKLKHSTIQHGLLNRRVYLIKLQPQDLPGIIPQLDAIARKNGYEKVLAKVPGKHKGLFREEAYDPEAMVPKFFRDQDDAFFMAKYFSQQRKVMVDGDRIEEILSLASSREKKKTRSKIAANQTFHRCQAADAPEMSRLFKTVFQTYPFPVFDPQFLIKSMNGHTPYFCVRKNGRIIAVAASEMDHENRCVEMTDFATLSEYRGQSLASYLLREMEKEMARQGMKTFFSIARSLSPAMNITLSNYGYTFGGTLINSTNISGRIESMNVWYKHLQN